MSIHDWTRVTAGTFHAFHLAWIAELQQTLNGGGALLQPLFLDSDHYIDVLLEATYAAAYATMPRRWRHVIDGCHN